MRGPFDQEIESKEDGDNSFETRLTEAYSALFAHYTYRGVASLCKTSRAFIHPSHEAPILFAAVGVPRREREIGPKESSCVLRKSGVKKRRQILTVFFFLGLDGVCVLIGQIASGLSFRPP